MDENKYKNLMDDEIIVTFHTEEGTEVNCLALCNITLEGKTYISVAPLTEEGDFTPDGDVFFYTFALDENNEPVIDDIESDDTYEDVSIAFDHWMELMEQEEVQEALDSEE